MIAGTRPDETFFTSTYLDLAVGSATVSESRDARARFVASLQPGDAQYVSVFAWADLADELTSSRSVDLTTPNSPAEFLPRLDDVIRFASDGTSAAWDELPVADYAAASLFSSSLDHQLRLTATKQWVDRYQLTELVVDASPPGFDPAWLPTAPQPQVSFRLVTEDAQRSTSLQRFVRPSVRIHARPEIRRRAKH